MKINYLVAALIVLAASPAFSQNDSGIYLGAGVGRFKAKIDDVTAGPVSLGSFDSTDTSFKVFAGWRFLPYLAAELDYIDLGKPEENVGGVNVKTQLSGVAPYVIGTLPVGPIELFAKVGYYFYNIKINEGGVRSVDENTENLAYGAGVGLTLFQHLHAQVEYEVIDASKLDKSDAFWLSGAWRF